MNLSAILLTGGQSRRLGMNKLQIKNGQVPLFIEQIFKLSFFFNEIMISTSKKNLSIIEGECENIEKYLENFSEIASSGMICGIEIGNEFKSFLKSPGIKIVVDDLDDIREGRSIRETGPIAGIYSGLKAARNHFSFILAFDMPFVSYRLIKALVDILEKSNDFEKRESLEVDRASRYDALIVKTKNGFEVLSGIYSKNCMDALKDNIFKSDNKISNIFKKIKTSFFNEEMLIARNLDMLNFFNINRVEDYSRFKNIWDNEFLKCKHAVEAEDNYLNRWAGFFFR